MDNNEIKNKLEQKHNVNVELNSIFTKGNAVYFSYNLDNINAEIGWQIGMDSLGALKDFEMFE